MIQIAVAGEAHVSKNFEVSSTLLLQEGVFEFDSELERV